MMRGKLILLSIAALALAACEPGAVQSRDNAVFRASNGFIVHPLDAGRFEVIPRGNSSSKGFFCAAGDYAQRRLGEPPAARVVLLSPVGPAINNPGGRSAKFAVAPQGAARNSSIFVNTRRAGESLTIGHARTLCNRDFPGFFPD